jgi:hypothetical protein
MILPLPRSRTFLFQHITNRRSWERPSSSPLPLFLSCEKQSRTRVRKHEILLRRLKKNFRKIWKSNSATTRKKKFPASQYSTEFSLLHFGLRNPRKKWDFCGGFPSTKWECTPRTERKSIRNGKEWREGTERRRRTSAVFYSGHCSFSLDGRDVIRNSNPKAQKHDTWKKT